MPNGKPGSLTDQEYLDLVSFVLQQNKYPAGAEALTVESATDIWIPGAGGAEGLTDYTYVAGVGCLNQDPTRSWLLVKAQGLKKTDAAAGATPVAFTDAAGEYTFRLLNAYNYAPEPQNGHRVRISGYLVRLGAEIRVFVQQLQPLGVSCDGAPMPASSVAPIMAPPVQQQPAIVPPAAPNPSSSSARTVWSGVYSEAQAFRGEKVADTVCLGCHGARLAGGDSGPKLAGADFLGEWNARSAGELFSYISEKMPENAPGTLKQDDVAAVLAYILQVNAMPSGGQDLPAERAALDGIAILPARP
jgi:mono/diheme cytochrome c family protein